MKVVELKYSKSKIDKAGDILKRGTAISEEERDAALEVLSNWRAFHVVLIKTMSFAHEVS